MSEEQIQQDHNDGTWSGLKKTIVGTIGTVVTGGGVWLGTALFGGNHEEKVEPAPAQQTQPTIVINNSQQQQAASGGTKVIERVVERPTTQPAQPAAPAPKKKEFTETPQW